MATLRVALTPLTLNFAASLRELCLDHSYLRQDGTGPVLGGADGNTLCRFPCSRIHTLIQLTSYLPGLLGALEQANLQTVLQS